MHQQSRQSMIIDAPYNLKALMALASKSASTSVPENGRDDDRTYIFTFDSLGRHHDQTIRKLTGYLKMEALDKNKAVNAGGVASKFVLVDSRFDQFCLLVAQ